MVDWMVEVLTTFKNSDQTFFLAINLMDRSFKQSTASLPSSELHLAGVVSMFIASKYEDIVPLLMRTVVNKIGHNKFTVRQIEEKELDLLKIIEYKVGAPTVKEFLDRFLEELTDLIPKSDKFYKALMCLSKMSCFSYELMQLPTSLLAAAILYIGLKLGGAIAGVKCEMQDILCVLAALADQEEEKILEAATTLYKFAQNFEKKFPSLKNLKNVYGDELNALKL
jgi:hypothetical protein